MWVVLFVISVILSRILFIMVKRNYHYNIKETPKESYRDVNGHLTTSLREWLR